MYPSFQGYIRYVSLLFPLIRPRRGTYIIMMILILVMTVQLCYVVYLTLSYNYIQIIGYSVSFMLHQILTPSIITAAYKGQESCQ